MRKVLFSVASLSVAGSSFAGTTDNATVNVNLTGVQSIVVNPSQKTVNLNIASSDDYINAAGATGVSANEAAHLKVISTSQGFKVKITASNDLTNASANATIPVTDVFVQASNAAQTNGGNAPTISGTGYGSAIALGTNAQEILGSAGLNGATLGTQFDVVYTLKNVADIANKPSGTYTTTVTYSIEAN